MTIYLIGMFFTAGLFIGEGLEEESDFSDWLITVAAIIGWPIALGLIVAWYYND